MRRRRTTWVGHAAALAWLGLATACHTMQPAARSVLEAADPPPQVWITGADHARVLVDAPRMSGDTLTGFVHGEPEHFLLSQGAAVQVRTVSVRRTLALAIAAAGATLGTLSYLEHRPDVGNAQSCTTGSFGSLPVDCCKVMVPIAC